MPNDIALQTDLAVRLVVAAALGAVIGLEREIHGHQAGMRTHMLVSLGSAIFTVLSIYGFTKVGDTTTAPDPTRIAAQIVSGIGFLGAGAILKFGTNIRGLTTAASLWVVAAVGLAAGAAAYVVAATGTVIAILSLWPLHLLVQRAQLEGAHRVRLRILLKELESFAGVSQVLLEHRVAIVSIQTERADGGHQMELEVSLPRAGQLHRIATEVGRVPGVDVQSITLAEEA